MSRSGTSAIVSRLAPRPARDRIAWCIDGTAEYHVGRTCSIQAKNRSALNPGVQWTLAPAPRLDSTAPTKP